MPETELSLATVVPYANSPIMTASSKIAVTGVGSDGDAPDDSTDPNAGRTQTLE